MRGSYVIRNPYMQPQIVGVGGNPVPIELGYDRALAKEATAQPDLEGGSESMYQTESYAFREDAVRMPNGSNLPVSVVRLIRKV